MATIEKSLRWLFAQRLSEMTILRISSAKSRLGLVSSLLASPGLGPVDRLLAGGMKGSSVWPVARIDMPVMVMPADMAMAMAVTVNVRAGSERTIRSIILWKRNGRG